MGPLRHLIFFIAVTGFLEVPDWSIYITADSNTSRFDLISFNLKPIAEADFPGTVSGFIRHFKFYFRSQTSDRQTCDPSLFRSRRMKVIGFGFSLGLLLESC